MLDIDLFSVLEKKDLVIKNLQQNLKETLKETSLALKNSISSVSNASQSSHLKSSLLRKNGEIFFLKRKISEIFAENSRLKSEKKILEKLNFVLSLQMKENSRENRGILGEKEREILEARKEREETMKEVLDVEGENLRLRRENKEMREEVKYN